MSQEIIYTSAPKGLKLGSRGFCTVVSTAGMSKSLAERLESLSGYRHVFPPQSAEAHLNPVAYSCVTTQVSGMTYYVVSRVADAGIDYSGRTNKLAHHIALTAAELSPAGPAWLAAQPDVLQTNFSGEPRVLPQGRALPRGELTPKVCTAWQQAAGDAGWAGVLAHTLAEGPRREACLVFRPGMQLLPLIAEAQALLPAELRWQATFSTYFTKLPPGVTCRWRCVLEGSEEAAAARRSPHVLMIDLCQPLGVPAASPHVEAARAGTRLPIATAPHLPTSPATERAHAAPASHAADSSGLLEPAPPTLPPTVPPRNVPPLRTGEFPSIAPRREQPRRRSHTILFGLLAGLLIGAGGTGLMLYFTEPDTTIAAPPDGAEPAEQPKEKRETPPAKKEGDAQKSGGEASSTGKESPEPDDQKKPANAEANAPSAEVKPANDAAAPMESEPPNKAPQPSTENTSGANEKTPEQEKPMSSEPNEPEAPQQAAAPPPKEKPKTEPNNQATSKAPKGDPFKELPWDFPLPERIAYSGGVAPQSASQSAELTLLSSPEAIDLEIIPLFTKQKTYRLERDGKGSDETTWKLLTADSPSEVGTFLVRRSGQGKSTLQFQWAPPSVGLAQSKSGDHPEELKKYALYLKAGKTGPSEVVPLRRIEVFQPSPLKLTQRTYDGSVTLAGLPVDKDTHYRIILERTTLPDQKKPVVKEGLITIPFGPSYKDDKRDLRLEYRLTLKKESAPVVKGTVYLADLKNHLDTQTLKQRLSSTSRTANDNQIATFEESLRAKQRNELPSTKGEARENLENEIKNIESNIAHQEFLNSVIDARSKFDYTIHCRVVVENPVDKKGPPVTVAIIEDDPKGKKTEGSR